MDTALVMGQARAGIQATTPAGGTHGTTRASRWHDVYPSVDPSAQAVEPDLT